MSAVAPAELLRPGLLEGVSIMLAHAPAEAPADAGPPLRDALAEGARALSARLGECPLPVDEELLAQRLRDERAPDLLVVDAAGLYVAATEPAPVGESVPPGQAALGRTMQLTWEVTRTVAGALIEQQRPGRIVLLAPPDGGVGPAEVGLYARAARAGLENLARTLSIEWSRYAITTVAIAPGAGTSAQTLAALCAYLASPAGAYFSGCVLALDGPGRPGPGGGGES